MVDSKDDQLRPHIYKDGGITYIYYVEDLLFLGRTRTINGFRNFFYVSYIRSNAYVANAQTPARGFHFLLCVKDNGALEFYGSTDAPASKIKLHGGILQIEETSLDLQTEEGIKYLKEVRPL